MIQRTTAKFERVFTSNVKFYAFFFYIFNVINKIFGDESIFSLLHKLIDKNTGKISLSNII